MKTIYRSLATLELLLIFPAALFMAALFARSIQPQQLEPAHTAQRIVDWYASSVPVGLWLLLVMLPLIVLIIGTATLVREWRRNSDFREAASRFLALARAHAAQLLIATATASAACILAIVAMHMLTD